VRVRDVGRVELAKRDYSMESRMNGKIGTTIGIFQQPGAKRRGDRHRGAKAAGGVEETVPSGLDYKIALDTSLFTLNSIEKVVHTFFEAVVLVVAVVFLFLQSIRATIIPSSRCRCRSSARSSACICWASRSTC